jgi:hypothetical protein
LFELFFLNSFFQFSSESPSLKAVDGDSLLFSDDVQGKPLMLEAAVVKPVFLIH